MRHIIRDIIYVEYSKHTILFETLPRFCLRFRSSSNLSFLAGEGSRVLQFSFITPIKDNFSSDNFSPKKL